ncbi:MAG TPA: hypothetical protein VK212_09480 [Lentimicrobium sp.]|nr:hypothetical protein [Lentimicrobium sp.]
MSHFRIHILFLLLAIPCLLKSQVIFEYSDTSNFIFTYIPYERTINNKVLNQLALAHLKIPEKTSFNYKLRHRISVSYRQSDSLYILLDVKPLSITGDTQLKDFNLEKLLVPSAYDVSIEVSNSHSGMILNNRRTVVMEQGMTAVATFPDSLWIDGTDVRVNINGISFTTDDYNRMETELRAIRDYYASAMLADTLLRKIQKARRSICTIENATNTYITSFKGIYLIEEAINVSTDLVPGKDPMNVAQKIPLLKYHLKEYIEFVNQSGNPVLTGNVYQKFASAYIKSIEEAGALSRSVDYYSSPFIYKLYANSITSWQVNSACLLLMETIVNRGMSGYNISKLKHEILKGYLNESSNLIRANRYVEAVDLLTGATKINNLPFNDPSSDGVDNALAEARKGLISSYTAIMQKALDKGLISLAEKYLAEVADYTTRFKMTNSEKGPFKEIYLRMADSYIFLGINSISEMNYDNALNEFTKAVDLLNGYQSNLKNKAEEGLLMAVRSIYELKISQTEREIIAGEYNKASVSLANAIQFAAKYPSFFPDRIYQYELEKKIAHIKYINLINSTLKIDQQGINHEAISNLCNAVDLLKKYQFPDRTILDTLTLKIGLRYLNDQFSKARLHFWANRPDSALNTANEAFAMSIRLDLNYLPTVKEQYEKVAELAGETWCNEVKGEYNSMLNKLRSLFMENKISQAVLLANETKELAFSKASCGLTTSEVNKVLAKYKQQIRWNEITGKAFDLIEQKKFIEATKLIQQAESIYEYYRLDTTDLVNIGFFELAMKSDDISLITFAINHLINKGELDQAILLLDNLRLAGVTEKQTGNLQEMLGRKLAQRDIIDTPRLNVKLMIKTYTKENDWYRRFENVYKYYANQGSNTESKSGKFKNKT